MSKILGYTFVAGAKVPVYSRGDLPITIPDQVNGTAASFISFASTFKCWVTDLVIDNLDIVNGLTFRINNPTGVGTIKTLVAGGSMAFSDQIITTLEILAGSTSWEVTFSKVALNEGEG